MRRFCWLLGPLIFVGGCGPQSKPIRGEWVMDGNPTPITFHFNEDGTYLALVSGAGFDIRQHGEYSQNGSWLHMYVKKFEASDKRLQAEYDKTRREPQHMRAKWKSEDIILLDSGQGTRAMRRVRK